MGAVGILTQMQARALLHVLCNAQDFECCICRKPMDRVRGSRRQESPLRPTLEHVMPTSMGGAYGRGNVLASHNRCNNAKGDRWPTEAELALLAEINARLGWTKEKAA